MYIPPINGTSGFVPQQAAGITYNAPVFGKDSTTFWSEDPNNYSKYTNGYLAATEAQAGDERARQQGYLSQMANTLVQGVGTFATAAGSTLASIGAVPFSLASGIGEIASGGDDIGGAFAKPFVNNPVSIFMHETNKAIADAMPVYRSRESQEGLNYYTSMGALTDLINGTGFLLSNVLPAKLIASGVSAGLNAALTVGKSAKANSVFNALKNGKALNTIADNADDIAKLSATQKMISNMSGATSSIVARTGESAMEALGVEDELKPKLKQMVDKGLITQEEANRRIQNAKTGTFGLNMLLGMSDYSQLARMAGNPMLKKMGDKTVGGFAKRDDIFDIVKKDGKYVANAPSGITFRGKELVSNKTLTALGRPLVNAAQEMGEEGFQHAVSKTTEDIALGKPVTGYQDYFQKTLNTLAKNIGETVTSHDGWKAMVLGGVLGGGMSAIGDRGAYTNKLNNTIQAADDLNNNTTSDYKQKEDAIYSGSKYENAVNKFKGGLTDKEKEIRANLQAALKDKATKKNEKTAIQKLLNNDEELYSAPSVAFANAKEAEEERAIINQKTTEIKDRLYNKPKTELQKAKEGDTGTTEETPAIAMGTTTKEEQEAGIEQTKEELKNKDLKPKEEAIDATTPAKEKVVPPSKKDIAKARQEINNLWVDYYKRKNAMYYSGDKSVDNRKKKYKEALKSEYTPADLGIEGEGKTWDNLTPEESVIANERLREEANKAKKDMRDQKAYEENKKKILEGKSEEIRAKAIKKYGQLVSQKYANQGLEVIDMVPAVEQMEMQKQVWEQQKIALQESKKLSPEQKDQATKQLDEQIKAHDEQIQQINEYAKIDPSITRKTIAPATASNMNKIGQLEFQKEQVLLDLKATKEEKESQIDAINKQQVYLKTFYNMRANNYDSMLNEYEAMLKQSDDEIGKMTGESKNARQKLQETIESVKEAKSIFENIQYNPVFGQIYGKDGKINTDILDAVASNLAMQKSNINTIQKIEQRNQELKTLNTSKMSVDELSAFDTKIKENNDKITELKNTIKPFEAKAKTTTELLKKDPKEIVSIDDTQIKASRAKLDAAIKDLPEIDLGLTDNYFNPLKENLEKSNKDLDEEIASLLSPETERSENDFDTLKDRQAKLKENQDTLNELNSLIELNKKKDKLSQEEVLTRYTEFKKKNKLQAEIIKKRDEDFKKDPMSNEKYKNSMGILEENRAESTKFDEEEIQNADERASINTDLDKINAQIIETINAKKQASMNDDELLDYADKNFATEEQKDEFLNKVLVQDKKSPEEYVTELENFNKLKSDLEDKLKSIPEPRDKTEIDKKLQTSESILDKIKRDLDPDYAKQKLQEEFDNDSNMTESEYQIKLDRINRRRDGNLGQLETFDNKTNDYTKELDESIKNAKTTTIGDQLQKDKEDFYDEWVKNNEDIVKNKKGIEDTNNLLEYGRLDSTQAEEYKSNKDLKKRLESNVFELAKIYDSYRNGTRLSENNMSLDDLQDDLGVYKDYLNIKKKQKEAEEKHKAKSKRLKLQELVKRQELLQQMMNEKITFYNSMIDINSLTTFGDLDTMVNKVLPTLIDRFTKVIKQETAINKQRLKNKQKTKRSFTMNTFGKKLYDTDTNESLKDMDTGKIEDSDKEMNETVQQEESESPIEQAVENEEEITIAGVQMSKRNFQLLLQTFFGRTTMGKSKITVKPDLTIKLNLEASETILNYLRDTQKAYNNQLNEIQIDSHLKLIDEIKIEIERVNEELKDLIQERRDDTETLEESKQKMISAIKLLTTEKQIAQAEIENLNGLLEDLKEQIENDNKTNPRDQFKQDSAVLFDAIREKEKEIQDIETKLRELNLRKDVYSRQTKEELDKRIDKRQLGLQYSKTVEKMISDLQQLREDKQIELDKIENNNFQINQTIKNNEVFYNQKEKELNKAKIDYADKIKDFEQEHFDMMDNMSAIKSKQLQQKIYQATQLRDKIAELEKLLPEILNTNKELDKQMDNYIPLYNETNEAFDSYLSQTQTGLDKQRNEEILAYGEEQKLIPQLKIQRQLLAEESKYKFKKYAQEYLASLIQEEEELINLNEIYKDNDDAHWLNLSKEYTAPTAETIFRTTGDQERLTKSDLRAGNSQAIWAEALRTMSFPKSTILKFETNDDVISVVVSDETGTPILFNGNKITTTIMDPYFKNPNSEETVNEYFNFLDTSNKISRNAMAYFNSLTENMKWAVKKHMMIKGNRLFQPDTVLESVNIENIIKEITGLGEFRDKIKDGTTQYVAIQSQSNGINTPSKNLNTPNQIFGHNNFTINVAENDTTVIQNGDNMAKTFEFPKGAVYATDGTRTVKLKTIPLTSKEAELAVKLIALLKNEKGFNATVKTQEGTKTFKNKTILKREVEKERISGLLDGILFWNKEAEYDETNPYNLFVSRGYLIYGNKTVLVKELMDKRGKLTKEGKEVAKWITANKQRSFLNTTKDVYTHPTDVVVKKGEFVVMTKVYWPNKDKTQNGYIQYLNKNKLLGANIVAESDNALQNTNAYFVFGQAIDKKDLKEIKTSETKTDTQNETDKNSVSEIIFKKLFTPHEGFLKAGGVPAALSVFEILNINGNDTLNQIFDNYLKQQNNLLIAKDQIKIMKSLFFKNIPMDIALKDLPQTENFKQIINNNLSYSNITDVLINANGSSFNYDEIRNNSVSKINFGAIFHNYEIPIEKIIEPILKKKPEADIEGKPILNYFFGASKQQLVDLISTNPLLFLQAMNNNFKDNQSLNKVLPKSTTEETKTEIKEELKDNPKEDTTPTNITSLKELVKGTNNASIVQLAAFVENDSDQAQTDMFIKMFNEKDKDTAKSMFDEIGSKYKIRFERGAPNGITKNKTDVEKNFLEAVFALHDIKNENSKLEPVLLEYLKVTRYKAPAELAMQSMFDAIENKDLSKIKELLKEDYISDDLINTISVADLPLSRAEVKAINDKIEAQKELERQEQERIDREKAEQEAQSESTKVTSHLETQSETQTEVQLEVAPIIKTPIKYKYEIPTMQDVKSFIDFDKANNYFKEKIDAKVKEEKQKPEYNEKDNSFDEKKYRTNRLGDFISTTISIYQYVIKNNEHFPSLFDNDVIILSDTFKNKYNKLISDYGINYNTEWLGNTYNKDDISNAMTELGEILFDDYLKFLSEIGYNAPLIPFTGTMPEALVENTQSKTTPVTEAAKEQPVPEIVKETPQTEEAKAAEDPKLVSVAVTKTTIPMEKELADKVNEVAKEETKQEDTSMTSTIKNENKPPKPTSTSKKVSITKVVKKEAPTKEETLNKDKKIIEKTRKPRKEENTFKPITNDKADAQQKVDEQKDNCSPFNN